MTDPCTQVERLERIERMVDAMSRTIGTLLGNGHEGTLVRQIATDTERITELEDSIFGSSESIGIVTKVDRIDQRTLIIIRLMVAGIVGGFGAIAYAIFSHVFG